MGPPGVPSYVIVQNVFPESDPRNQRGPGGKPGKYKLVFTLSRPGFSLQPETSFSFEKGLQGDSHLAIVPPAVIWEGRNPPVEIRVLAQTPEGKFPVRGLPNQAGFLGKLVLEEIDGENLKDAAARGLLAISSYLSWASMYSDIPLNVYQVDVTELRTGNSLMSIVSPYSPAAHGQMPSSGLPVDLRLYASFTVRPLAATALHISFSVISRLSRESEGEMRDALQKQQRRVR